MSTRASREVASWVRRIGDLDLADAAVQEACVRALAVWPTQGVPQDRSDWRHDAKNIAIDRLRRESHCALEASGRPI